MNAKTKAAAPLPPMTNLRQASGSAGNTLTDARAKQVLKEAVDAVVNSFAKHTQGYGRAKINEVLKTGNKMVGGNRRNGAPFSRRFQDHRHLHRHQFELNLDGQVKESVSSPLYQDLSLDYS
ncbi:hypothetical protein M8J76_013356 [Diaphorina citri]|nr:hypothetical protein M8J75_005472 [Diaphorina citri]KAI5745676.1 hypothetical protein M8J76_013356 [Diaphorina citri]